MNDEGIHLISTAEDEAVEAMAMIQQARRTLKEARAKQHQVRLSRQYYKVSTEKGKIGGRSSSTTSTGIKCFKCGGNHKTRTPTPRTVRFGVIDGVRPRPSLQ